uniref:IS4 family transposase n=1 Tax=Mesocestoides corti TaxID=53468 RepID=A0A5K3FWR5_MESCO
KDRYNRTSFIDQSEARATRQAPSIRVPDTGHAALYLLHLWLAACLPRRAWNTERHRIGIGQVVQHVCALIRRNCRLPEP